MNELTLLSNDDLPAVAGLSAAHLNSMVHCSPDGIVVMDPEGTIEYVNKASETMFGHSADRLVGRSFGYPVISGDTTEIEVLRLGTPTCVAEMRVVKVEWKGRTSFLATLRDVSERIQLTKELIRTNKDLEKFASVVSHEIRAPLRNLHLLCGWLLEDHSGDLNTDATEDVQLIGKTTARMQRMVEDLVSYSRCGLQHKVTPQVDLGEVLIDALDSLHDEITRTDAHIFHDRLPTIDCNRQQIVSVFQHILSNAIAYCTETPRIMINVSRDDDIWKISFIDNGIGVNEKYWDKIFVPFNHLHSKDAYDGTGIGLATCRKMVELHRGRIWLESDPEVGSVVHVCLPEKRP